MEQSLDNLIDSLTHIKDSEKKAAKLREIVPIEEWLNSPYYAGDDIASIYPFWKNHIANIFNSKVKINEIIFTGGIRNSVRPQYLI